MEEPLVTVYIPSSNYGKFLTEAIESVLRQNFTSWELILIDESSEDNSWEIMNYYKNDNRVSIYQTEKIGLPSVANFAISKSRGKYIIRLDADDIFDENILLVLSNYLNLNEKIALVFPDYFLMDEQGVVYAQERRQAIYFNNHLIDAPPNGACTLIRKSVLDEIGGYRADLGAQDGFDLWSKIREKYKSANVNVPLFYYRRHGDNLTERKSFILNARRVIKKDSIAKNLNQSRPILGIILCRRNYDHVLDLWSQSLGEKSLLDVAIERCLNSNIFDKVIVASDNLETENSLKKYTDPRLNFFERRTVDTIRSRPVSESISEILERFDPNFSGISVLSILQAPFLSKGTIEEVIYSLLYNDSDTSILVKEVETDLFERTPYGLMQLNYKGVLRTDFDSLYIDTKTCIATKNSILKSGALTGSKVVSTLIPEKENLYIRNARDLKIANILITGRNDD